MMTTTTDQPSHENATWTDRVFFFLSLVFQRLSAIKEDSWGDWHSNSTKVRLNHPRKVGMTMKKAQSSSSSLSFPHNHASNSLTIYCLLLCHQHNESIQSSLFFYFTVTNARQLRFKIADNGTMVTISIVETEPETWNELHCFPSGAHKQK